VALRGRILLGDESIVRFFFEISRGKRLILAEDGSGGNRTSHFRTEFQNPETGRIERRVKVFLFIIDGSKL
jgi:hypothetical protein